MCPRALVFPPPRTCSRYNGGVPFAIRDFQSADFETLWRIDQSCFAPGISYSRAELRFYIRHRASFTLVAVSGAPCFSHPSREVALASEAEVSIPPDSTTAEAGKSSPPRDASIAGFIVAEAASRARGHIITIDVIAAARRFGVGSLLLRAAEDRLISSGCRAVELETAVDNLSALAFYKRHGYSVVKTSPRYYSNGVDALVLEKTLILPR